MARKRFRHTNDSMIFSNSTEMDGQVFKSDNIDFYTQDDTSQLEEEKENAVNKKTLSDEKASNEELRIKKEHEIVEMPRNKEENLDIDKVSYTLDKEAEKQIQKTLVLPKHLKDLVNLYKIILNVYNYNKVRKLNLVFAYHKESMERVYKHTITLNKLKQIYYLCQEDIAYRKMKYKDFDTFTITVKKETEIEEVLYELILNKHSEFLAKLEQSATESMVYKNFHPYFKLNEIKVPEKDLFTTTEPQKEAQSSLKEESKSKKKKLTTEEEFKRIIEKNRQKEIDRRNQFIKQKMVPGDKDTTITGENTKENDNAKTNPNGSQTKDTLILEPEDQALKKTVDDKYNEILNRIQEREKVRKDQFMKNERIKVDYSEKLKNIFNIENKKAIKLKELVFRIGDYKAEENILNSLGELFEVRVINKEKYIIKR